VTLRRWPPGANRRYQTGSHLVGRYFGAGPFTPLGSIEENPIRLQLMMPKCTASLQYSINSPPWYSTHLILHSFDRPSATQARLKAKEGQCNTKASTWRQDDKGAINRPKSPRRTRQHTEVKHKATSRLTTTRQGTGINTTCRTTRTDMSTSHVTPQARTDLQESVTARHPVPSSFTGTSGHTHLSSRPVKARSKRKNAAVHGSSSLQAPTMWSAYSSGEIPPPKIPEDTLPGRMPSTPPH
jgi:hypothetical protein